MAFEAPEEPSLNTEQETINQLGRCYTGKENRWLQARTITVLDRTILYSMAELAMQARLQFGPSNCVS